MKTRLVNVWPNSKKEGLGDQGIFHGFGTNFEEFESGPGLFPIAIIEFPGGDVRSIDIDCIRFANPGF